MKITFEQAQAFVEALTGWDGVSAYGDDSGSRKSPHAYTHLESVLGLGRVLRTHNLGNFRVERSGPYCSLNRRRIEEFITYLRAVCDALELEIQVAEEKKP